MRPFEYAARKKADVDRRVLEKEPGEESRVRKDEDVKSGEEENFSEDELLKEAEKKEDQMI